MDTSKEEHRRAIKKEAKQKYNRRGREREEMQKEVKNLPQQTTANQIALTTQHIPRRKYRINKKWHNNRRNTKPTASQAE